MITASEYLRANTNTEQCENMNMNNTNSTTCLTTNWMYNIVPSDRYIWTISPASLSTHVFYLRGDSSYAGSLRNIVVNFDNAVVPVLNLSSDITLTGEGTQSNPYAIIS